MNDTPEINNRILIVEDDPMSSQLLQDLLESEGYTNLATAPDGPTALQQIAEETPDLILMDVMMPGMTGFDVCKQLKENPKTVTIPIVLVTALSDRDTRLKGLEMGANDFLTKPIDEAELLARTRSLLKLKELHDEIAELARERIEFVGQVSHELRTPLFAVSGLTEMLLDGEVTDPDQAQRYLETIYEQSNHLSKIVNDLLDLSRLERDQLDLELTPLLLNSFLDDTLVLLHPEAGKQDIDLRLGEVVEDLLVLADEVRLRQVMVNLLNNALIYNDPGGWVEVSASRDGRWARISVNDSGWGIHESDLPHIFDRFYRGRDAQEKGVPRGSGLGLALVQEIVRSHGGQIWAASEGIRGKGSNFNLRLPLADSDVTNEEK